VMSLLKRTELSIREMTHSRQGRISGLGLRMTWNGMIPMLLQHGEGLFS